MENNVNGSREVDDSEVNKNSQMPSTKNGISDFMQRLKDIRSKKADARTSRFIDLACFAVIVVLVLKFKTADLPTPSNSIMYYREEAEVVNMEYVGTENGKRWRVVLEYSVGSEQRQRNLYYKKKPDYTEGDIVVLKVETINPDRIEVEGKR